jgi:hypothetical protein
MSSMHLDEEQVQRYLHGELAPPAAVSAGEHLEACVECRSRVTEAEREERGVLDLLRHLDDPAPGVDFRTVVGARERRRGWGRWAAGIVLALAAAGAAYAAPGSPLRGLVARVVTWLDDEPRSGDPTARRSDATAPAGADESGRGIAVAPGDRFIIAFPSHQPEGLAAVSLTDGAEVVVRASSADATFTSGVDRLFVDNRGSSAHFQIEIPRSAPRVDIWIAGRRVFSKGPGGVIAEGGRDADGRYLLPLSPRGS